MKKIFVSLVTYNGADDTRECLASLDKSVTKGFSLHVIVVDNQSTVPFTVREKYKNFSLEILHNKKNLGFGGGHNSALAHALDAGADYVMILNNDTTVDTKLIETLFQAMEHDTTIGIAAPKIYFAKDHEFHKDRYTKEEKGKVIWYAGGVMDWDNIYGSHRGVDTVDTGQFDTMEPTEFASGCCMMLRKEALATVGFFDEAYFLYYEDSDLNERIKRAGYSVMYIPKAFLWHKNAKSTGGSGSALQDYFISRNRIIFASHYASIRTKVALIKESVIVLFTGRHWQRRGVVDFYLGKYRKGSYRV